MRSLWLAFAGAICWLGAAMAADQPQLELVRRISLKGPAGRLDHLVLDAKGRRLFVANMAGGTLDVVDQESGKILRQIPGQAGIQGIAFAPDLNRVFTGNAEGGICNVFDGQDYRLLKTIKFADDADNVRYDPHTHRVYVGHAETAIGVIDAKSLELVSDVNLPAAAESFQVEKGRPRLYVNTPDTRQVVVIDTEKIELVHRFPLTLAGGNYPMALDEALRRIFIGCRRPPMLVVLDSESGKELASVPIPGDTDDVFFDAAHKRIYASCGDGFIAVIRQIDADHYELMTKVATVKGARTSLFDPDTGRIYLVVPRQQGKEGPEIWEYKIRP